VSHAPCRPRALLLAVSLLAGAPALAGCVVAAAGAGAAGGYSVLGQELSPEQQVRDKAIAAAIRQKWGDYNQEVAHDLNATVYDGRVLLTGRVPRQDWQAEAVKRAWQVEGVKEVYDEIEVGADTHFLDEARDAAISSRLRSDLLFDKYIKSINYTVTTENGVVYIIGSARSQEELNRVTDYARNIANVRRVVSYVRIRSGAPPPPQAAGASAMPAGAAGVAPEDTPPSAPTPRAAIEVTPLK
jgi:osmotically-inducible protein OsmY